MLLTQTRITQLFLVPKQFCKRKFAFCSYVKKLFVSMNTKVKVLLYLIDEIN
jgi:hypothetical protein